VVYCGSSSSGGCSRGRLQRDGCRLVEVVYGSVYGASTTLLPCGGLAVCSRLAVGRAVYSRLVIGKTIYSRLVVVEWLVAVVTRRGNALTLPYNSIGFISI